MPRYKEVVALVAALTVTSGAANSACRLTDMAGKWQLYAAGYMPSIVANYVFFCTMTASESGLLTGKCNGTGVPTQPIENGGFVLEKGRKCAFTGNIEVAGNTRDLEAFTLSHDKNLANGVGKFFGSEQFLFTLTRI